MKYKKISFIILLVVLSLLYTWYEANRPQPLNWSETYSYRDKIPYGTFIAWHSLPQLFPESEIVVSRLSPEEQLNPWDTNRLGCYIFVNRVFNPDRTSLNHLLEWVDSGNSLFVAAEHIADTLLEIFSLATETTYGKHQTKFVAPDTCGREYSLFALMGDYFTVPRDFPGKILGINIKAGQPDFLALSHGKGKVFLNLNPKGFTNRCILDTICGDYYNRALSWLPDQRQTVIWDAYLSLGRDEVQTPLRVILKYPALTLALYLVLAVALLYVLFRSKREQRPIPEVEIPANKMLEFIATVSALYYRQKDHSAIAMKRIDFFLGSLRTHYHLRADRFDDSLVSLLSERSGVAQVKTEQLFRLIAEIQAGAQVDEEKLAQLMKGSEEFLRRMR